MTLRCWLVAALFMFGSATASPAQPGISDGVVRIGLLLDMSGTYSDYSGEGAAEAARMAVADFGGTVLGKPIEVLAADHLNKADVASARAREWFDVGRVDTIIETVGTAPALAVLDIARQKNKLVVFSGPGAVRLTNENCSPISIHYALDSYALARSTVRALANLGGTSWYVIALDAAFGADLVKDTTDALAEVGGKLVGVTRHPLATQDFSSFILAGQGSGAAVLAFANAGKDTANGIKAAREFGVGTQQRIASLYSLINDVHAIGLESAQGLLITEAFYWNLNEETRAWSRRYFDRMKAMPNAEQAAVYSSTLHYLNAVRASGTDSTEAVVAAMRTTPVDDMFARGGRIREDGRMVHDMYLMQVKKPSESTGPWDVYNLVSVIPGDEAFQPLSKSRCPLVTRR